MLTLKKKQSLAESINDVITDGAKTFNSDDEDEVTKAKVVDQQSESDSDDAPTGASFRKQNVHLLDEVDARYQGKKVSRKDIYENESYDSDDDDLENNEDSGDAMDDMCDMDSDDGNSDSQQEADDNSDAAADDDDDDDDEDEEDDDDDDNNNNEEDDDNDDDNETEMSDDEESDFDEDNPLGRNRDGENNFPSMTPININQEIEKGNCVRNQLKAWENLLEMRIKLQKCLSTSNKMPQYDVFKEYQTDKQFSEAAKDTKTKLSNALEGLLELQEKLWKNNPETKNLLSNKQNNDKSKTNKDDSMDEEIPSDTDEEMEQDDKDKSDNDDNDDDDTKEPANKKRKTLDEFEKILAKRHSVYTPYRNSVIQKWNDKTRVATGNASTGTSQAVVKQIEFLLSNKQKLISRTQLKRSEYSIIGKKDKVDDDDGRRIQEYDTEIYDDDDFYHQLLRELIEHKSADITDPIQLGKQWVQLQNMRTKMKRKIDTRATKGRRVRYNVHTKLVNFMAPNALDDKWSDLAKTELYNSLFGKIKVVQRNQKKNEPDVEDI